MCLSSGPLSSYRCEVHSKICVPLLYAKGYAALIHSFIALAAHLIDLRFQQQKWIIDILVCWAVDRLLGLAWPMSRPEHLVSQQLATKDPRRFNQLK